VTPTGRAQAISGVRGRSRERRALAPTEKRARPARGDAAAMTIGIVKWFNPTKGYGFVAPDEGGKDVFVHISAVQKAGLRTLNQGEKISFEVESQKDGRAAAINLGRAQ
jgi:CspA family cold shock protein